MHVLITAPPPPPPLPSPPSGTSSSPSRCISRGARPQGVSPSMHVLITAPPPLPSLKVHLPGELTFASKVSVCVYDAGAAFGLSALQDLAPSDTVMGRTLAPSGPYTKNVSVFYNKYLRC